MTELARPRRHQEEHAEFVAPRVTVTWETGAYGAILVAAFLSRFWDLGSRALHHDESLHAYLADELYSGRGFEHSPLIHGPLQIFATALAFFVGGGPSDTAARVLPALLGTALVAMPLLLRERLGRLGALATAALIALSPTLLYFSRFTRNDIWIAVFTLALAVCVWRYLDERRPRYLYGAAGLLALSFATKENAFIVAATFVAFLNLWAASDLGGQTLDQRGEPRYFRPFYTMCYVPIAWLIAALWPFVPGLRRQFGLAERPASFDLLIVIGTLAGPQFAAAIQIPVEAFGTSIDTAAGQRALGIPTVVTLLVASAAVGLRWNWRTWLGCAALFYVPYTLLYTSFFTDVSGFGSGMWESLDYWLAQHGERRADQPDFFYLMFLPSYEMLALAFAGPALLYFSLKGGVRSTLLTVISVLSLLAFFGADSFGAGGFVEAIAFAGLPVGLIAAFFAVRESPFVRFLAFWTAASIVAYSYFGEKFPWLFVHMALPVAVLAGYTVGRVADAVQASWHRGRPESRPYTRYKAVARRWALPAVVVVVFVPLAVLTAWTAARVTYAHGDVARELMIYTQTTADVPELADEIHTLAEETGLREEMRIHVDRSFGYPWAWYLRDYNVTFDPITLDFEPEPGGLVIISTREDAQMSAYRDRYETPQQFRLREFHAEDYRGIGDDNLLAAIGGFITDLFEGGTWSNWWDYMIHRDLERIGLTGYLYVPAEYRAIDIGPDEPDGGPRPTRPPAQDIEGRLIVGGPGEEPGLMRGPIGIALDGDGNPYVVDNGNDRIQKFTAIGEQAGLAGGSGTEPGQFTQPSDIAVGPDGSVWVADTWNHRVQKLSAELEPVLSYGVPTRNLINPGDDQLWGPRGIAIDREGNVLFTDTGTHRVRVIAPDGTYITSFGGRGSTPGKFEEPVGIAVAPDGSVYVADAGNARIQKFDAEYHFLAELAVDEWARRDPRNKPHIATLPDGRLLATDALAGQILLIGEDGVVQDRIGAVADVPLFFPAGVAFDAARDFVWVTDSAAGHIRRFPLSDFALR